MTSEVPVKLLLDVDNVVNADRPRWPDKDRRAHLEHGGVRYPMRWSPQLIARLDGLHQRGVAEVIWCTTWCPQADALNALFGTGFRAWWSEPVDAVAARRAKLDAAHAVLDAGFRLIWCDDDAIPRKADRLKIGLTGDALFVVPYPASGLTPGHLRQIEAFATRPLALCAG